MSLNQFGDLYSQYYDLLYSDKNYIGEVDYVDGLIKQFSKKKETLLDMGCGTGRHAEIFCGKGYVVHGVDISEAMLKIAKERRIGKEDKLNFTHTNISNLNSKKKFDVVISLFHVMSYQTTNDELVKAFEIAKSHMDEDGLFIFDFWYGPAVLRCLPEIRVKRFENESIIVTRIGEPELDIQENIVTVNYDICIQNKTTKEVVEKKESHKMRYFFDTELEIICNKVGLNIEVKHEWMCDKNPGMNSWNVVWVLSK